MAILLAVTGVVIIHLGNTDPIQETGGPVTGRLLLGSVLVFGAVLCEAAFTLLGKISTDRLKPLTTGFLATSLSIPLFLAPALLLEVPGFDPGSVPGGSWLALGVWGAGTLGLGSILWYSGIRRTSGTVAAGFMGVMPVSALVFSYWMLGEPVRWSHLIGFGIVFLGVVLISYEHRRKAT